MTESNNVVRFVFFLELATHFYYLDYSTPSSISLILTYTFKL